MAAAIGIRTDHTSEDLRWFARRCGDPDQVRRLLAIALILDGGSRSDAASLLGSRCRSCGTGSCASTQMVLMGCPAEGKAAGIVMPRCNSEAMSMHLEEIAFHVAPGVHAVVILDQAGWHGSAELVVPPNITLLPLPPRCPELNLCTNIAST